MSNGPGNPPPQHGPKSSVIGLMGLLGAVRKMWLCPSAGTNEMPATWPRLLTTYALVSELARVPKSLAALIVELGAVRKARLTPAAFWVWPTTWPMSLMFHLMIRRPPRV